MNPDSLMILAGLIPAGFFACLICLECLKNVSNKWDKAMWTLGAQFALLIVAGAALWLLWGFPR